MFTWMKRCGMLFLCLFFLLSFVSAGSWEQVTRPDTIGITITSLAVNSMGHVFLSVADRGIFRSTNNGTSWELLSDSLLPPLWTIGISPKDNIYAMGNWGTGFDAIYFSRDNGNSWQMSDTSDHSISAFDARCFGFDSAGYVYAGSGGGIMQTTDSTNEWINWSAGIPCCRQVTDLEYDPVSDLMLATLSGNDSSGVFKRGPFDTEWTRIGGDFDYNAVNACLITSDGEYIVGTDYGIYRYDEVSKSGGGGITPQDWLWLWPQDTTENAILRLVQTPDNYIIAFLGYDDWGGGSGTGVFISSDNGNSWREYENGLPDEPQITSAAVEHSCGAYMYAGSSLSGAVYRRNACAICGDANGDMIVNVGDPIYLISYIFKGGRAPDPIEAGDADGSGSVNIGDAIFLINFIFNDGQRPICPVE